MPGWHAKTEALVESGKLKVLGITQEQHPDRTRLFMQWKQMDWPVLLDSLNLLECKGIPFTLLVDEHGVVRFQNPKSAQLETFLATDYETPQPTSGETVVWPVRSSPEGAVLWGGDAEIDGAIESLQAQVAERPRDGRSKFRLGVAYRQRYDGSKRREGDFAAAIEAWKGALEIDSSQYIWRRRIQQYGPRLDKPYSFYDWVHGAREAITKRGETPVSLIAESSGAEFAHPERGDQRAQEEEHPDPKGRVPLDRQGMVTVQGTVVPSTKRGAPAVRVHLKFTPDLLRKVHWTNDAGPLSFFPDDGEGYEVRHIQRAFDQPKAATSDETRRIEFEVRPDAEVDNGSLPAVVEGSAYYYVCEDVNGRCLFLRQRISVPLTEASEPTP